MARTIISRLKKKVQARVALLLLVFLSASVDAGAGAVKDPVGVAPDRYAYYPDKEALAEDEMVKGFMKQFDIKPKKIEQ